MAELLYNNSLYLNFKGKYMQKGRILHFGLAPTAFWQITVPQQQQQQISSEQPLLPLPKNTEILWLSTNHLNVHKQIWQGSWTYMTSGEVEPEMCARKTVRSQSFNSQHFLCSTDFSFSHFLFSLSLKLSYTCVLYM